MRNVLNAVLIAVLTIGLTACAVCTPGTMNVTDKIVTTDLQLDPVPDEPMLTKIREKVLFNFDSYALDNEATSIVDKVAALMFQYPDTLLALKGHTDKYGAENYNQILSENRADAVEDALVDSGVDSGRILSVEGFGKSQLIPNLTNRENRRVLILSVGD